MISTNRPSIQGEVPVSDEMGGALVSSVLILLLLTILATAGFWLSRTEMQAAEGYAQSTRALYSAEAGFARYFATTTTADSLPMTFELYEDPCADTIAYPTPALQNACEDEDDSEEEELLEDIEALAPAPATYDFLNTSVIVTADFVMNNGVTPMYEVFSRATVTDPRNPELTITRMLAQYSEVSPPFDIKSPFTALGGIEFGGDAGDHYHFDGKAKAGKTGSCGTSTALPGLTVPSGQFDLPLPDGDCPGGKGCPYKWHSKGNASPADVDSTAATSGEITSDIGLDWSDWQDDAFFAGLSGVMSMADSDSLEAYFAKSKDKTFKASPEWPIVRFEGDLVTDQRIKGYGILIVEGDVIITNDKIEWTGIMLVGGKIITQDGFSHIHVKGAAITGLGCTEAEVAAGDCRTELDGEHNDIKYRPCEIAQSWRRMMIMTPTESLWREITGN